MSEALIASARLWVGLSLIVLGASGGLCVLLRSPKAVPALAVHAAALDNALGRALKPPRGLEIVRVQVCATALVLLAASLAPWALAGLALVWGTPLLLLRRHLARRVLEIEAQLDGWLVGLTSALRSSPALGEAVRSTVPLVRGALREELLVVMRQFKLGTPLDDALVGFANRTGSAPLSAVVATLRIARKTGGNLATTLERNAATLREMARLEAVVRTKTASGRAQANTICVVPLGLVLMLDHLDPTFLAPLWDTVEGNLIAALCCLMWVVAVFWARKIVAVDI